MPKKVTRRARRLSLLATPPSAVLPEFERSLDEGMLIARSAATLATKNHLIVTALRDDRRFDRDEAVEYLRSTLLQLAGEQSDSADRIRHRALAAANVKGRASDIHDYRQADFKALMLRAQISDALAQQLTERADDKTFLDEVVEKARQRAWEEVGDSIRSRLDAALIPIDDDYTAHRDERLAELASDLRHLLDV